MPRRKDVIGEVFGAIEDAKGEIVIVEGKKDKDALKELGFEDTRVIAGKRVDEIVEEVEKDARGNGKKVVLLTDLDKEGRKLYSGLKKMLNGIGIKVDDRFRRILFRTRLRQIEGIGKLLK